MASMAALRGSMILVCGGAGYIGSHVCKALAAAGATPVVFDNLSSGHRWAVRWGPLVVGDLLDPAALADVFRVHSVDAVMHFAARSLVTESIANPSLYFRNNVTGTLNLLDAMRGAGVAHLVFSSTAAVYGAPSEVPITEAHATVPINPYGWSKLMAERQIAEYCGAFGMRAIALRYFNAAGADPEGELGESHDPETHLIPRLLDAASTGMRAELYGDDYPTPDGTCIRDYVHVWDLCAAHLLALSRLRVREGMEVFNVGGGQGNSVAQVLDACREATAQQISEVRLPRRPGDPPVLVASVAAAAAELGWTPQLGLRDCIADALAWKARVPRPAYGAEASP